MTVFTESKFFQRPFRLLVSEDQQDNSTANNNHSRQQQQQHTNKETFFPFLLQQQQQLPKCLSFYGSIHSSDNTVVSNTSNCSGSPDFDNSMEPFQIDHDSTKSTQDTVSTNNSLAMDEEEEIEYEEQTPLGNGHAQTTTTSNTPTNGHHHHHSGMLGVVPLAVMVFYSVSGGPFGCEASVRSAGNFYTLVGFLVAPFVWSLQEALMTAELGAAFPEASGGVAWVEEAFGPGAGWMSGYLGWIAGATDNAIYPVLFLDYLLQVVQTDGNDDGDGSSPMPSWLRFAMLATTSVALAFVNWLGLNVVGNMSVIICLIAMSPFFVFTLVGAFKVDPSNWFTMPMRDMDTVVRAFDDNELDGGFFPLASWGGILWRPFLNNLFWNLNSFDAAASFAADTENPGTVLPRAMMWAVVMVFSAYFFPLLVALGASNATQNEWVDGYLGKVASDVVGHWLGAWTVLAAGISNIALFQAELSADAFQLMGMSERGHIPSIFSVRSRHGTPTYGILLGTALIVVMGASHLDSLIEMLNFNYAIALLMEYCAFIKLRMSRPDLHRPYRVPLNTFGCILFLAPTFLLTFVTLGLATYWTFFFSIATNAVGLLIYASRRRGHFNFEGKRDYTSIMARDAESSVTDAPTETEMTFA